MTIKDKYHLLCSTSPTLPLFSLDWWLDITCGPENWTVLLVEEKERILAALPLYIPAPGIVSMPPFTQTMGPWFAPESEDTKYTKALGKRQDLCKQFTKQLRSFRHFLQNFNYRITDWLPFYWEGYQQTTRYTYLLQDIKNQEVLWDNMSANIRRNITKARDKHRITVKKGIPVEAFLQIQEQTFERQQKKMWEDSRILAGLIIASRERGQGDLWGGYDEEGRLHAAAFVVWQGNSAYYLGGGGDPALRDSGAQSLILWECIRYASQYTDTFDFEGSMLPGVERFFREFGAIQTPFFTITKGKLSLIHKTWLKLGRLIK